MDRSDSMLVIISMSVVFQGLACAVY